MLLQSWPTMRGKFIVLEGIDGSGTTTQCELLKNYLSIKSRKVLLTKEPTNNLIGGLIRGVLTHDWSISPEGLQLLFCADRAHHLEKEIIPALERGMDVICDRYLFSTLAFGKINCDLEWLRQLNKHFLLPDLTIIFDIDPSECARRIAKSRIRFELFEEEEKLKKVLQNYRELAGLYPNLYLIDANRERELILQEIVQKVDKHLLKETN